jgi:metallo-beta-lactamase class B
VNEGHKLVSNAAYPQIAGDYERMFKVLRSLHCDVFLGAHGGYYGMEEKYVRLKGAGANPFIDAGGYKSYVNDRDAAFQAELAKQRAAAQ